MGLHLDFSISDAAIRVGFQKLKQLGVDARPVMREIAGALADSSEQAFANERDPETGNAWQSLSDEYKARREKKGYTGKMLQMRGQLAMSLTTDYSARRARIGSPLVYAAIHQLGGLPGMAPGSAAVPARPYLGLDTTARMETIAAIQDAISGALGS